MLKTIIIIIVMVVINLLMVFAIIQLKNQTSKKVKKYFLDKTGSFKVEYDKHINDDESINTNDVFQQSVKNLYLVDEKNKTTYKDSNFKENYRIVKEQMNFDKEHIVLEVIDKINDTKLQDYKTYSIQRLSSQLSFNTIFELSTLNKDEQLSILKDSFDDRVGKFIDKYLDMVTYNKFNLLNFYDYLIQQAKMCDNNIYVKTGWEEDNFNHLGKNIVTVYDEDIIEGIRIIYKDKIYDYSL